MRKSLMLFLPIVWFTVHWIVPRVYVALCAPHGIYGFFQSIVLSTSPHCEALRYTLSIASYNINYTWITWGTAILGFMSTNWNVQKPKIH